MDRVDQVRDDDTTVDSVTLLDLLLKVSQLVRIHLNDWLDQFELNDGRYGVLSVLSRAKDCGLSQADLAEILGQSASNVSTLIERMARDGLVDRLQSKTDRRKRMWSISSQGQTRFASVEAKRSAWASRLFKVMSNGEKQTLMDLMQKFGFSDETSVEVPVTNVVASTTTVNATMDSDHHFHPVSDPHSPQFALQQMLLALSSSADAELRLESEAA